MNEFRKLMNIMEGRVDDPDVVYRMEGDTKSKTLDKEFNKVIAEVSGKVSERFTKLANKFIEISELNKTVERLRNETNEKTKEAMEGFFDAGDNIYTRVIRTKKIAITMTKDVLDKQVRNEKFDHKKFMEDLNLLMEGLDEEVVSSINLLIEKHTKVEDKLVAGRKGTILPPKIFEDASNDLLAAKKIGDLVEKVTELKMQKFDQVLDTLEAKY